MATNLVSLAMRYLTPELVMKMASALGVDKTLAQKAVGGAIPAILAGLVGRVMKPDGARTLADAVTKQDSSLLGNLAGMLSGGVQSSLASGGTAALTSLLGSSALGSLTNALAKFSGIGDAPAKGLLGMLGPVVLGSIAQEQKANKLDAGGLVSLLSAQKDNIAAAMPADFAKLLGGTAIMDAIKMPAAASTSAAPSRKVEMPARSASGPSLATSGAVQAPAAPWWRLPLVAAIALGLGWALFGTAPHPSLTGPGAAVRSIVVDNVDVGGLATGTIETLRTALGGIRDSGTAQAAIPRLQDAAAQLDRVTALAAKLSPETRSQLAAVVASGNNSLTPMFASILALPGVSAVAKPAIDAVRAKLDVLSRA